MKFPLKLSQLWLWREEIPRTAYFLWGFILLALKYNLDRALTWYFQSESLPPYVMPYLNGLQWLLGEPTSPTDLQFNALNLSLLTAALPFVLAGVGLTLQRLRSADLPRVLVVLFFVPFVNFLFFLLLCLWPERNREHNPQEPALLRLLPHSFWGSALASMGISMVLTLLLITVSVLIFKEYGMALFVGLPFMMGLTTTLIFSAREHRSLGACLKVSLLHMTLVGAAIIAVALEGLICVLMAMPLAAVLTLMGTLVGWLIQRRQRPLPTQGVMLMLFLPGFMGIEKAADLPPPRVEAVTAIEINAPPEVVWQHVVSFSELPPPQSLILKTGIAYPVKAEIKGNGVGAVRHCVFSTGAFVEPIEIWDQPRHLKFSVIEQPAPMKELTPYAIQPPHLDHFLQSKAGQFVLNPLPNGGTRLEGTTWYEHKIWPAAYWQIWSDLIIHSIHREVLSHIKNLSESEKSAQTVSQPQLPNS